MSFSGHVVRFLGMFVCASLGGCVMESTEPEYGFGEADMQSAIVGDWTGTMSLTGQMPTTFTLSIKQVPTMQPACGSRTFSSPLCIETSSMSLEGTLTTADMAFNEAKLQGSFLVIGLELRNGEVNLAGGGLNMAGGIDMTETSHTLSISGTQSGSATLER